MAAPSGERDLRRLLAGMTPVLDPVTYAFCLADASGTPPDLPVVARRLAAAGVSEFVFAAAFHQDRDMRRLDGFAPVPARTERVGQWRLYVMRRPCTGANRCSSGL